MFIRKLFNIFIYIIITAICYGFSPPPLFSQENGIELLLLIDDSESMKHYNNSQKEKAITYCKEILSQYNGSGLNKIGIIRFASKAYVSFELTDISNISETGISEDLKATDVENTDFASAFYLAYKKFDGSMAKSPHILLITDGILRDSTEELREASDGKERDNILQRLIIDKLSPSIERLKGCVINVLLVRKDGDNAEEEKVFWRNYIKYPGLIYSYNISETDDTLNNIYDLFIATMLKLYSIELKNPKYTHPIDESLVIEAILLKHGDTLPNGHSMVELKGDIVWHPSKFAKKDILLKRQNNMYSCQPEKQPSNEDKDKFCIIKIDAYVENEQNSIAKFEKKIFFLDSSKQSTDISDILTDISDIFIKNLLYNIVCLSILLIILLIVIFRDTFIQLFLIITPFIIKLTKGKFGISFIGRQVKRYYKEYSKSKKKAEKHCSNSFISFYNGLEALPNRKNRESIFKEEIKKLGLSMTDEVSLHSLAHMIAHSIEERKYLINFFNDIIMIIQIIGFKEAVSLKIFYSKVIGLLTDSEEKKTDQIKNEKNQDKISDIKKRIEELKKCRKIYEGYSGLLEINDDRLAILKHFIESIKEMKEVSDRDEIGKKYSSIYEKFESIIEEDAIPDIFFLKEVDHSLASYSNDSDIKDPNDFFIKRILIAIQDYILKRIDPRSTEVDLVIELLDKDEGIYYSEMKLNDEKDEKIDAYLSFPIKLINKGLGIAENLRIQVKNMRQELGYFRTQGGNLLKELRGIIPVKYDEEWKHKEGIELTEVKLHSKWESKSEKIFEGNIEEINCIDVEIIVDFFEQASGESKAEDKIVYFGHRKMKQRTKSEKFENIPIKHRRIEEESLSNPLVSPSNFLSRNIIIESIKNKMDKETSSVINVYGLPGIGKTMLISHLKLEDYTEPIYVFRTIDNNNALADDAQGIKEIDLTEAKFTKEIKKINSSSQGKKLICIDDIETTFKKDSGSSFQNAWKTVSHLLGNNCIDLILCSRESLKRMNLQNPSFKSMIKGLKSVKIPFFSKEEVKQLLGQITCKERAVELVMRETGGYPQLLNELICYMIKSKKNWIYDRPFDFGDVKEACNKLKSDKEKAEKGKKLSEIISEQLGLDDKEQRMLKILSQKLSMTKNVTYINLAESFTTGDPTSADEMQEAIFIITKLISKDIISEHSGLLDFSIHMLQEEESKEESDERRTN
jgi:uncharacterized protein YegL